MNEQKLRFRIGLFVLGSLVVLTLLVSTFGNLSLWFKRNHIYILEYENAHGVGPGTPVRRSGIRIGEVTSVVLDNDTGKVQVVIQVPEEFKIRKADRATLVHNLISGDASIALLPTPHSKESGFVEPGSTLHGFTQADTGTLMQRTSDLMIPAQQTFNEIAKTLRRVDQVTPLIEETLREFRDTAKATRETVPGMGRTTDEIREIAKASRDAFPNIRKTNDELIELLKSTRQTVPDLKKTNDEVQVAMRNWGKVGERTDVMLQNNEEKITRSLERFADTVKRVNELLNDDNLSNIKATLKNVKDGSEKLESLTKNAEEFLKEGRTTLNQLKGSMQKADELVANLNRAAGPLADRTPFLLKNVEDGLTTFNKTLCDVREIVQVFGRSEGTIQKLICDPSLYNNLNDSTSMLTKILPRLDRIMRDVEIFADKIARHPESLGISGVVRPGSGVKENPGSFRIFPH